jgi:bzd-type benzoyl-CoA reductase N subunit
MIRKIDELVELCKVPLNRVVEDWKEEGKKVIGFHCSYVPEEIIHAGGALPYRIRPVGCTEVPLANVYMTDIHCTFARGCLEFILRGNFDFLDGLVSMSSCDNMLRIHDICKGAGKSYPFMHFLSVPYKIADEAVKRYTGEIVKFKEGLENYMGLEITDEKIRDAIKVYNETRSLLKRLYEFRRQEKPPVTGSEALGVTTTATVTPKREFNKLLSEALREITEEEGVSKYRARLMIVGSALDTPDYIKIIEDLGGLVCTDTLCFGSRYFWEPVETDGDLLSNLAKSYLNRPCCARIVNQFAMKDGYLEEMIKAYKIDGVIHQRLRYCDLFGGDLLHVRKKLDKMNIPLLALEREYWLTGVGQIRTRVQAFLGSIEARR